MKTNNLPDYPRIEAAELLQLKLDSVAARRFERRFFPSVLGGAGLAFAGFFGSIVLHHFGAISDPSFAIACVGSFVLGLAIAFWTHHRMMRARPRSTRNGHEMVPFIIRDVEAPGRYELAYVDQSSGTYFKRVYVEHGG